MLVQLETLRVTIQAESFFYCLNKHRSVSSLSLLLKEV